MRPPPTPLVPRRRSPADLFSENFPPNCDNLHINADIFSEGKAVYKRSYPPTGMRTKSKGKEALPVRLVRLPPVGVYQSFAKFRGKFARSAAGAEFFRNLPLAAPLASQAHAAHMYRIIIERYMYGPRSSLGGHLRQDLTSNCLAIFVTSAQPPTAPPRRVPRAALAHVGAHPRPASPAAPTRLARHAGASSHF